jgi:hypothetical protein
MGGGTSSSRGGSSGGSGIESKPMTIELEGVIKGENIYLANKRYADKLYRNS